MRALGLIRRFAAPTAGLVLGLTGCSQPSPGAGGGGGDANIATVNGDAITSKEYVAYLERKPTIQVITPQGATEAQVAGMLGVQALQDLIQKKIVLQLAKEEGELPTDADVKAELDFQEQQRGNFIQQLTSQGVDLKTIKDEIQLSLARENLQTKGITVPMKEVDEFIKNNPQQFMEPEKASLKWIVVSDPKKKDLVDKDLKSGKDFQTAAIQYSEAPDARQSGGNSVELVAQMPQQLQDLVRKTPELKTTTWLADGGNWIKFYVQKKTAAKKMEITDARKRAVQRQLELQRGSAANDVQKRIVEKLRTAKIDVTPKNLREPWERLFEQAKDQLARQEAGAGAAQPGAVTPPAGAPTAGTTAGASK